MADLLCFLISLAIFAALIAWDRHCGIFK